MHSASGSPQASKFSMYCRKLRSSQDGVANQHWIWVQVVPHHQGWRPFHGCLLKIWPKICTKSMVQNGVHFVIHFVTVSSPFPKCCDSSSNITNVMKGESTLVRWQFDLQLSISSAIIRLYHLTAGSNLSWHGILWDSPTKKSHFLLTSHISSRQP